MSASLEVEEKVFQEFKQRIEQGKKHQFQVITASMAPLIEPGDSIEVNKVTRPLRKFDIVVFWDGKILICHYVWQKNRLPSPSGDVVYITRALGGKGFDFPVAERKILGLVISHRLSWFMRLKELFVKRKWYERAR